MKKQHPGFFLTIEGGEGAGKSTLIESLYSYLTEKGENVVKTIEPGGTPFGLKVRELVLQERRVAISARAELFLFLADRAHHVETMILPLLQQDTIVLCDRFTDSSIAYQGAARQINLDELKEVCLFATNQLVPDLTFYLDLDPEIAFTRIKRGMDRMESEKIEFHKRVRAGYIALARENPDRIHLLDATLPREQVFEHALTKLKICARI